MTQIAGLVHARGMSFGEAVALGLVAGASRVAALGVNTASAALASFWPGNAAYPWIPSARTLELVSSSANDAVAGTGAQKILVQGLDLNYNAQQEFVTPNGTTAVALSLTYLRINGAIVTQAGSLQTNAGSINIRDTGAGTVRATMPVDADGMGTGFLSQTAYTVPAGNTLLVQSVLLGINRSGAGSNNNVTARNWVFNPLTGALVRPLQISTSSNLPYRHESGAGYPLFTVQEKRDLDLVISTSSSALNVTGAYLGTLVSNTTVLVQ